MTIADFYRFIRHNTWLFLVMTLVGVAGGAGYSFLQPVLYSSTATGYVVAGSGDTVGSASSSMALAQAKANAYRPLVSSSRVTTAVAEALAKTYPAPQFSLAANSIEGSNLFLVTAVSSEAGQARDAADAGLKATAAEALRLDSMTASGGSTNTAVVRIVPTGAADLPASPFSPRWVVNLIVGAVVGLALGFGLGLVRRGIDGRIRSQADLEELGGISTLGILPRADDFGRKKGGASAAPAVGPTAEALRQLRTNLRFVAVDQPPRSIVITSANPGEGKSSVAAQLARVLAASGQRVVLIDADLRRPTQSKHFGVDGTVGLTQVLSGDVPLEESLQNTDTPNLLILTSGRIAPNPSELVGSKRMRQVVEALTEKAAVIIDAPPLLPVTDAGLLTAAADGAILVTRVNVTLKEQVRLCTKLLDKVHGRLLGAVLNMTPKRSIGTATYGYGFGGYDTGRYDSKYVRPAVEPEPSADLATPSASAPRRARRRP